MAKGDTKRGGACGGVGGVWFLAFLGAFAYYLHTHSGTVWLVLVAFTKAVFWPAFLVYHLLALHAHP